MNGPDFTFQNLGNIALLWSHTPRAAIWARERIHEGTLAPIANGTGAVIAKHDVAGTLAALVEDGLSVCSAAV